MTDTPSASSPAPALKKRRFDAAAWAPYISLIVPVVFFSFAADGFLRLGTLSLILQQGAVLAIAAVGLTFVLLCAEIDLSVGFMGLFVAAFCGVLYSKFGLNSEGEETLNLFKLLLVVGVPLLTAVALGFIAGYFTVSARLPSFIITLAMMNITYGLALYMTQSAKQPVPSLFRKLGNDSFRLVKLDRDILSLPYSTILAVVILIIGHIVLTHTRFGRHVYMTGGNREAARLAGVKTNLIVVQCLAICAFTAGLAGLIEAGRLESVTMDLNSELLLNAVACVVLGGTSLFGGEGSMGRTAIGVLTFTVLSVGLRAIPSDVIENFEYMRHFVMGVILLVALVINGHLSKGKN